MQVYIYIYTHTHTYTYIYIIYLHLSSKETLSKEGYFWHVPTQLALTHEHNLILSYIITHESDCVPDQVHPYMQLSVAQNLWMAV